MSGYVIALRNVLSEPLTNSINGSFTGKSSEPHKTVCSIICGTPVSSVTGVLKPILKTLLSSSFDKITTLAPVFLCFSKYAFELTSSICLFIILSYCCKSFTSIVYLSLSKISSVYTNIFFIFYPLYIKTLSIQIGCLLYKEIFLILFIFVVRITYI